MPKKAKPKPKGKRKAKAAKRKPTEDFNQAAFRVVREATKDR
jgi:hypothetical protein